MAELPRFLVELRERRISPEIEWSLGETIYESSEFIQPKKVHSIGSTDYITLTPHIRDWTLEYWVGSTCDILGMCLSETALNKLSKMLKFLPLEELIEEIVDKIKSKYDICTQESQIIEDPDLHSDVLVVEIFVKERDPKKVIELWKAISNEIRREIDRKLDKKFQRELLIRVRSVE